MPARCEQVTPAEYGGEGATLAELTEYWLREATRQKEWFARCFYTAQCCF